MLLRNRNLLLLTAALSASLSVFASTADLVAVDLRFQNRAASGGDIGSPAHQYVVVTVRNQGDLAVGAASGGDGGFALSNPITIQIKGVSVSTFVAQVAPGATANINLNLPAGTLRSCEFAPIRIDTAFTAGQSGPGSVFANDSRRLFAGDVDNPRACFQIH